MAVQTLLETVESGAKNIEIAVLRHNQPMEFLTTEALVALEKEVVAEQEAAKKKPASEAAAAE